MADERTFVLIGEFKDGITPELTKINDSINSLKTSLRAFSTRKGSGFSEITQAVGSLVSANMHLTKSIAGVREELKDTIPLLKEYRQEVGKANRARYHFNRSGRTFAGKEAEAFDKLTRSVNTYKKSLSGVERVAAPRRIRTGRTRRSDAGDFTPAPVDFGRRGPRGSRSDGYGPVSRDATFAFGQTLGYQLSGVLTGAITKGFQIGVQMMQAPFQYFANALGERIQDELSDIQAAGGLLAVANRQNDPFVRSFRESMRFTQQMNARFAEVAAALPGNTQQYIEVGKRLGDTAARIVATSGTKAIEEASRLRVESGREAIVGTGRQAQQQAIQQILETMTTKTVLAGMGGGGGAGRAMGPYGLPQLTERLVGQDTVTMGQFQRYAAIFRDPAIAQALERFIPEINSAQKNTIERFNLIDKMFNEILPPDVIRAYERSLEGIIETYKTAFFNPETGLLGIGRKLQNIAPMMNQYGQYIKILEDGTEQVVQSAAEATKDSLSVFDLFRDAVANVAIVFGPIASNLNLIFDPMKGIAEALVDIRKNTGWLLYTFEEYSKGIADFAKGLSDVQRGEFMKISPLLRASLATLNNLFKQLNLISSAEFMKNADEIIAMDFDAGAMMKEFLDKLVNSPLAHSIGDAIGTVVGTVLTQVANIVKQLTGLMKPNQLIKGLKDGFVSSGGPTAIREILRGIFETIFRVAVEVFKLAPLELSILGAATLLLPAFAAAMTVAMGNWIEAGLDGGFKMFVDKLKNSPIIPKGKRPRKTKVPRETLGTRTGVIGAPKSAAFRAMPAKGRFNPLFPNVALPGPSFPGIGGVTGPYKAPKIVKQAKKASKFSKLLRGAKMKGVGALGALAMMPGIGGVMGKLGPMMKGPGLGALKTPGKFMKGMPGGGAFAIGTGVIDALIGLFSGDSLGEAIGKGAGPVLGSAIGFAVLGPLGSFIGGWIGGMEEVTRPLGQAFDSVISTLTTTFEFLGQIGGDLLGIFNGLFKNLFGLDEGFNILEAALFALLSPLRLLEIGIKGLYLLYLETKRRFFGGLDEGEKERYNTLTKEVGPGGTKLAQLNVDAAVAMGADPKKLLAAKEKELAAAKAEREAAKAQTGYRGGRRGGSYVAPSSVPSDKEKNLAAEIASLKERVDGKAGTGTAVPTTPVGKAQVATAASTEATAQSTSQTSKTTTQLSQTSATTQKNTANANTILGNIRMGIVALNKRVSGLQLGISAALLPISLGVTAIQTLLSSGQLKVQSSGMMGFGIGGPPGGNSGGPGIFGSIASKFGLSMTSGYRAGDPGYHGIDRARDYSNSNRPTPQMLAFAQYMYSTFGGTLKELIYTPLGFSIKNGKKVPAYAQSTHNDHVHVAFATGAPSFFSSLAEARSFENSNTPSGIKTLTTNSAELTGISDLMAEVKYGMGMPKKKTPGGGAANWMQLIDEDYTRNVKNKPFPGGPVRNSGRGGLDTWEGPGASNYIPTQGLYSRQGNMASAPTTFNAPITINQQPGQNSQELAAIVVQEIEREVFQKLSANIFI